MPAYDYKCTKCNAIFNVSMSVNSIGDFPTYPCLCGGVANRHYSSSIPSVNTGKCSRVYYQWKGDPDKCPPDLRRLLKNQDAPKSMSEFHKEGEPALGTGKKFEPRR